MPTGIKPAGFSGYETPPRRGGSNDGSRLRCWWPSRRKCREQLATALGGQDVSLLLVEGDRLSESIVGPGEVPVRPWSSNSPPSSAWVEVPTTTSCCV